MSNDVWAKVERQLTSALRLEARPITITFIRSDATTDAPAFDAPMATPVDDGRTGRVPAGCVFWIHATERTFQTLPEDHRNCSVGSLTHGLIDLKEAACRGDVAVLLETGWVDAEGVPLIPVVNELPSAVVYGPLGDTEVDPDVVLVRLNGAGLMTMKDAFPNLAIDGKPQCHIIAIAKEQGRLAASVGCALSRARTGISVNGNDVRHTRWYGARGSDPSS